MLVAGFVGFALGCVAMWVAHYIGWRLAGSPEPRHVI